MIVCPVEGCVRGDGVEWGSGPTFCVPHREQWAADHEAELTTKERKHWVDRNTWEDIGDDGKRIGEPWCTWPDNFKTPVRPSSEQLKNKGAA